MKTLKIFCDLTAEESVLMLLKRGVAPHQVVFPTKSASSVLSKSDCDPAMNDADIGFGQLDADGVLQAANLRWLQISSAGYTRYDTEAFRKRASDRKLVVTNSSAVYAEPCAEHVFAFMLAQARKLPEGLQAGKAGDSSSWLQLREGSRLLREQHVVILGFGSIARHLLKLLEPFRMKVVALRRKPVGDEGIPIISENELPDALSKADHVVNLLPANQGSVRFMAARRFQSMKKGAVFYNIGRGATVDQDALSDALRTTHLAAAWLDVTEPEPLPPGHPLLSAPNCFITPHVAGGHQNETESLVRHFLTNFRHFLEGTPLLDRVI